MNQSAVPGKIDRVIVLSDPDDLAPYLNKDKKNIVLFEMTGCPYCLIFQSRFLDFVDKRSEECAFLRVRLDDPGNPLWEKYDIIAVPTVIVFSSGSVIACADAVPGQGLAKKKWAKFCDCL
jgi:hypothetical protein